MLRSLYISAIILSLFAALAIPFQHDRIVRAYIRMDRMEYNEETEQYETIEPSPSFVARYENAKMLYTIMCFSALAFFLVLYILTLARLRTTTMLVLSIIGLIATVLMLGVTILGILSGRLGSFEMVAIAMTGYGAMMLAFSIAGVVHAFRKKK